MPPAEAGGPQQFHQIRVDPGELSGEHADGPDGVGPPQSVAKHTAIAQMYESQL